MILDDLSCTIDFLTVHGQTWRSGRMSVDKRQRVGIDFITITSKVQSDYAAIRIDIAQC